MESQEYEVLSESFMRIIVAIHRNFFRQMKLPLPINQFSVLKVLENEGPLTSRDLGEVLAISKQQLTPILEKLEQRTCIIRRVMVSDRRFIEISLTDEGRRSSPLSTSCCVNALKPICAPYRKKSWPPSPSRPRRF